MDMKENNKLTALTTEELQTKYKKSKGVVLGLGIVMLFASITLIYVAITTKNYAFIAVAIGSSMSFLPMIIEFKQIEKEIKSRNLK